jgi:hypothetical protein
MLRNRYLCLYRRAFDKKPGPYGLNPMETADAVTWPRGRLDVEDANKHLFTTIVQTIQVEPSQPGRVGCYHCLLNLFDWLTLECGPGVGRLALGRAVGRRRATPAPCQVEHYGHWQSLKGTAYVL